MDCVDEHVHDYCRFADDKCVLAAWSLNSKQWGTIVLPDLWKQLQEYKW
jgi:DNA primase